MKRPFLKAWATILQLLSQGITPEKIALSIALAVVLGVFPVLGSTTILCAAAAAGLGLNLPAMQLVNWVMYPVQLVLLVPLMRFGDRVVAFLTGHPIGVPPFQQLLGMVTSDLWGAIKLLWPATLGAIAAWIVVSPLIVALVYAVLVLPLRRVGRLMERTS